MSFKYGKRSMDKLRTVDPVLRAIAERALELSPYDITIVHGWRGEEVQNALQESGASTKRWPKIPITAVQSATPLNPSIQGRRVQASSTSSWVCSRRSAISVFRDCLANSVSSLVWRVCALICSACASTSSALASIYRALAAATS